MSREGLYDLNTGHFKCPECNYDYSESDTCVDCNTHRQTWDEPSFSWSPCECCGDTQGGNRTYASSYNTTTEEIQEYDSPGICCNCVYFSADGRLDDMTMLEIYGDEFFKGNY